MNKPEQELLREIRVIGSTTETISLYPGNALKLSRYTLFSILPKNLFEQFQRTSNIWFLIVSVFQLIPFQLNPTDAWTTILPLSILLVLTLLKDAYQDWKLKSQDQLVNNTEYACWLDSRFVNKKAQDLLVGDIILISNNQIVPADVLLLDCDNDSKILYSDMTKLIGSSVLKEVKAIEKHTNIIIHSGSDMLVSSKFKCTLKISQPNYDYSRFYGRFKLVGDPGSLELKVNNVIFRGSSIKGAQNAVCMVMYCGFETKLQMNSKMISHKTSMMEKRVNTWVIYILGVLVIIVFSSVIGFYSFNKYTTQDYSLLDPVITFILLYNNIIPISLFMVIDIIRTLQSFALTKMIKGVSFNTERVNENLGQVEYILTDKTGTITENNLKMSAFFIQNKAFIANPEFQIPTEEGKFFNDHIYNTFPNELDTFRALKDELLQCKTSEHKKFIKCLALCNNLKRFQSAFLGSRDEIAMIESAATLGYCLKDITKSHYTLEVLSRTRYFEVIASMPFTTLSKKSRIILHEPNKSYGILYLKGDFSCILQILELNKQEKAEIKRNCTEMNNKGLRTMVLAYKKIPIDEILEFRSRVKKAEQSLLNFDGKLESMFKETEKNAKYLGITCIEDEILPSTVRTIESLKQARIKLWVLSGDSFGNTNLSARAAKIVEPESLVFTLKYIGDAHNCFKALKILVRQAIFNDYQDNRLSDVIYIKNPAEDHNEESVLDDFTRKAPRSSVFKKLSDIEFNEQEFSKAFDPKSLNYSLFVDRSSFLAAISNEHCRKLLVALLVCARSVVFSGLMPEDKGNVVRLLKENVRFKPLVVAIGDGEGDISMLQNADVGISVNLSKNSILKNFSDLSITGFSDLEDLILVHGHWNYARLSTAIFLFIYKNSFLTLLLLSYTFLCAYSGTSLFNATLLVGYNIFFTTLPILVIGIFDEDVSEEQIKRNKEVYIQGIEGSLFNWKKLLFYAGLGIFQGVLLSIVIYMCAPYVMGVGGRTEDLENLGTLVYIALIFTVLIQIFLDTFCYNLLYFASQGLSLVILIVFIITVDQVSIRNSDLVGVASEIIEIPYAFFSIFLTSVICIIPIYAFYYYKALFFPNIVDKLKANLRNLQEYNKLESFSSCLTSLYIYSSSWKSSSKYERFSLSPFTLRYNHPYIEKEYKEAFRSENMTLIRFTVFALWVLMILWAIFSFVLLNESFILTLTRVIISALYGVLAFALFTEHFTRFFEYYVLLGILSGLLIKFALELSFSQASILAAALVPSITYILLNVDWVYITYLNILNVILIIISISVAFNNVSTTSALTVIGYITLIISITSTSTIVGYFLMKYKRTEHQLLNQANASVERNQGILSLLLPPFVKNRVKDGVRYIAEAQDEVTVLFCDICDFEGICRDYKPSDLREFLDSLFKIFDSLCENTGVTKIETVGKTYMACAGLSDSDQELPQSIRQIPHTRRALELALAMVQEVSTIRLTNGGWLHVKIGINSGPVIAGVVGYHKPQFSLVGDTVNTASRMCSTLTEYNSIQITENTYELLKNYADISFQPSMVEAKGKGNLKTFIVRELKDENSSDVAGGPNSTERFNHQYSETSSQLGKRSKTFMFESVSTALGNKLTRMNTVLIPTSSWTQGKCNESTREREFRHSTLAKKYRMVLLSLEIALVSYVINLMLSILAYYFIDNFSTIGIIVGRSVVVLCILIIIILHHKIYKHQLYPFIVFSVLLLMLVVALFNLIYSTDVLADFTALEIMYIIMILNHSSGASLLLILLANLSVFIPWVVLASNSTALSINITNLLLVACFSSINFLAIYIQDKKHRTNYNLTILANKEIKETEKLLVQMMPQRVLANLQNDISVTDKLDNVTILFADIVGFTNWSSDKSPEEVVQMLSQLFTRFDKICVEFDVYKVHTIGDCYVVLGFGGNKARDFENECLNVVRMAESMVEIINEENAIQGSDLNMRIGVHTGEVIAGVIGTNTVRYDIWGPDVLIANKMESGGKPGMINVSQMTRDILEKSFEHHFEFTLNSEIKIEALSKSIKCYFITKTGFSVSME